MIKMFNYGQYENDSTAKEPMFPSMAVQPESVQMNAGEAIHTFNIVFVDLPHSKNDGTVHEKEALSDCLQLAQDLCALIKLGTFFGEQVSIEGTPTATYVTQEGEHTLSGVQLSLSISVPFEWNVCDIPATFSTPGSSGPGVGNPSVGGLDCEELSMCPIIKSIIEIVGTIATPYTTKLPNALTATYAASAHGLLLVTGVMVLNTSNNEVEVLVNINQTNQDVIVSSNINLQNHTIIIS
jgi:hypothetical protein